MPVRSFRRSPPLHGPSSRCGANTKSAEAIIESVHTCIADIPAEPATTSNASIAQVRADTLKARVESRETDVVGPRRLDVTELAGYDAGCAIVEEKTELVQGAANTSGGFSVLVVSLGAHAVTSAQVTPRGPFFRSQTRLPPWHPHKTTMFRQNLSVVLSTFPRSLARHSRRRFSPNALRRINRIRAHHLYHRSRNVDR
jgi:hypothetical protein